MKRFAICAVAGLFALAACNDTTTVPNLAGPTGDVLFDHLDGFNYTYQEDWDGSRGTDSEQCGLNRTESGWIHWVFATKGDSDDARLELGGTGSGVYEPDEPLNAEVWHFVTPFFALDGLDATIFLNGEPGPGGGLVISDYCASLVDLEVEKTADASHTRTIEWELEKSVRLASADPFSGGALLPLSGGPGDTWDATWDMKATKTLDELGNWAITGTITTTNMNPVPVNVQVADELDDGTLVEINCSAGYAASPVSATVPAYGDLVCTYRASPTDTDATLNTATVTVVSYDPPAGYQGSIGGDGATAAVNWGAPTIVGEEEPLFRDVHEHEGTLFSKLITATTTEDYDETFTCPAAGSEDYVDGLYSESTLNTAYLEGDDMTNLQEEARVTLECAEVWEGETATASYAQWPGTRNWFHYADDTTQEIVTGRNLTPIGTLTFGDGEMCFQLDPGVRMDAAKSGNVKIHPMDNEPTGYIPPGQFSHHFDRTGSNFCVTIDYNNYNGVHLDVEILKD